jgi:tRNA (guanine-N7-)-methyltransferase
MTDKTENVHKTIEQAEKEGKYIRKVRSFVKREGRLTKGQASALEEFWSTMGLNHQDGMIDFASLFNNNNPIVLEIGFGMGKSLVEMAKNAPDLKFVGVEVHRPGVGACISLAQDVGVDYLKVFYNDDI